MLDIKFIRENPDVVKTAAKNKLINVDIDRLLQVDEDLRKVSQEADTLKEERNKLSSSIPTLSDEEKRNTITYVKELKEKIAILDEKIEPLKKEYTDLKLTDLLPLEDTLENQARSTMIKRIKG